MYRYLSLVLAATFSLSVAANENLLLQLSLNEGSGAVAIDSSGAGNDGALVGNPQYSTDTPDGSSHALQFDGAGDHIELGSIDVPGNALTLTAWFKAVSFPGVRRDPFIISKTTGNSLSETLFSLGTVGAGNGTRLRARISTAGSTTNLRAGSGSDLVLDRWYHAAAVYDGALFMLYLDGVVVGTTATSGAIDHAPDVDVLLGSRAPGVGEFDGLLDDIRIYNAALDAQAISK